MSLPWKPHDVAVKASFLICILKNQVTFGIFHGC